MVPVSGTPRIPATEADGPVVFLHPIGLDTEFWKDVASPEATVLDFPGFGGEPWPGSVSLPALVDFVADHITTPATVVGLSLGGMVALETAVHRPEKVRSLVVVAGGAKSHPDVMHQRAQDTRAGGMEGVLATTMERWFTEPALAAEPAHPGVAYARRRLLADDPGIFASYWEAMGAHDVDDALPSLRMPATVIAGARDRASSVDALRGVAEAIPGASFEVLEGPHMLALEEPEALRAAIRRHLDRIEGRS